MFEILLARARSSKIGVLKEIIRESIVAEGLLFETCEISSDTYNTPANFKISVQAWAMKTRPSMLRWALQLLMKPWLFLACNSQLPGTGCPELSFKVLGWGGLLWSFSNLSLHIAILVHT